MFSKIALSLLVCFAASPVLADPATPLSIALVKQQFINALITPAVVPAFNPTALLNASWPSVGAISTGQAIPMAGVSTKPNISIIGTAADFASGGNLNSSTKYTLIMIDGDYAGAAHPNGVNTHYLQNDLTYGQMTGDVLTLSGTTSPVIAYAGPGPAANSGAHRYILLAYAQPSAFTAPAIPVAGSSVTMIDFPTYISSANLGTPIAGNYFTVEVGTATVSASATSSVNAATLTFVQLSTAASSSATGSAASATSTATKSGTITLGSNGIATGVLALVLGAFMA